jgi:hypothetical protein
MADAQIEILVRPESDREGTKSLFESTAQVLTPIRTSTHDLTRNLAVFCQAFAEGIEGVADALMKYELSQIELTVELNAKGEVRLIASASTEIKGGIKLVFKRKD